VYFKESVDGPCSQMKEVIDFMARDAALSIKDSGHCSWKYLACICLLLSQCELYGGGDNSWSFVLFFDLCWQRHGKQRIFVKYNVPTC